MKRSEPVGNCGCQLVRDGKGLKMIDCSLHKAAPDLLEACKDVAEGLLRDARNYPDGNFPSSERFINRAKRLQAAIAKAEKGE